MKLVNALNKAYKRVYGDKPFVYDNGTIHFFDPYIASIPLNNMGLADIAYEFFIKPEYVSILVQELLKIMPIDNVPDKLKEDYLNYRWKAYDDYHYVCHSVHGVIIVKQYKDLPLDYAPSTLEDLFRSLDNLVRD